MRMKWTQVLVPFKLQWSVCTPKVRKHPGLKQRTLSFCLWINRQKMYESIVDNKQSLVLSVPRGMLRTGRLFWGRAGSSNHTSGSVYMACSLWCVLMVSRHHVHRSMPADFLQEKWTNRLRHLTLIYDPSTQGLRPLKFIIGGGRSSHWSLLLSLNLLTLKAKDSYICNWIIHQNDWGIKVFFLKNLRNTATVEFCMDKHHSNYDPWMYPSHFQMFLLSVSHLKVHMDATHELTQLNLQPPEECW